MMSLSQSQKIRLSIQSGFYNHSRCTNVLWFWLLRHSSISWKGKKRTINSETEPFVPFPCIRLFRDWIHASQSCYGYRAWSQKVLFHSTPRYDGLVEDARWLARCSEVVKSSSFHNQVCLRAANENQTDHYLRFVTETPWCSRITKYYTHTVSSVWKQKMVDN